MGALLSRDQACKSEPPTLTMSDNGIRRRPYGGHPAGVSPPCRNWVRMKQPIGRKGRAHACQRTTSRCLSVKEEFSILLSPRTSSSHPCARTHITLRPLLRGPGTTSTFLPLAHLMAYLPLMLPMVIAPPRDRSTCDLPITPTRAQTAQEASATRCPITSISGSPSNCEPSQAGLRTPDTSRA